MLFGSSCAQPTTTHNGGISSAISRTGRLESLQFAFLVDGRTPDKDKALFEHVRARNLRGVRRSLDEGASPNARGCYGPDDTALHFAAARGYTDIAEALIARGARLELTANPYGETPLMMAAAAGHVEVVSLLVTAGAKVNARSKHGSTALEYAVGRATHATRMSASGERDSRRREAIEEQQLEIVRYLVEHGAKVNLHSTGGPSVLTQATAWHAVKIADYLRNAGAF